MKMDKNKKKQILVGVVVIIVALFAYNYYNSDDVVTDAVCGDGVCNGGETQASCSQDCGTAQTYVCGDGTCNGDETEATCSTDCGTTIIYVCGDGTCNGDETQSSCPADCGTAAVTDYLSNVVSRYTMEGNANDIVGNNDGMASSVSFINGRDGTAAMLSGSGVIVIPITAELEATGDYSVSLWAMPTIDNGHSYIIAGWQIYLIQMFPDYGTIEAKVYSGVSGTTDELYADGLGLNIWQNIIWTYDASSQESVLYLNGVEYDRTVHPFPLYNAGRDIWIGNWAGQLHRGFYGMIDDVRIYDVTLTSTNAASIANA